jgi:hypothetical protein
VNGADLERRAWRIEQDLRREGTPPALIPAILGAALMAAMLNLEPRERARAITAHVAAVQSLIVSLLGIPGAAPDGLLPDPPFRRH